MKKIYAPWRSDYVEAIHQEKDLSAHGGCVFCCNFAATRDEENFILKRGIDCAIIMNLYPYSPGHLMVIPFKHIGELSLLSRQGRTEAMELVHTGIEILKKTIKPNGFNVGINLGKAAGAGIPSHMHIHIVPRWNGDTNFMPVIAEAKTISIDLKETYALLKKEFDLL